MRRTALAITMVLLTLFLLPTVSVAQTGTKVVPGFFSADAWAMNYPSKLWGVRPHGGTFFVIQSDADLQTVAGQPIVMRGAWIATMTLHTHEEAIRAIIPTYYPQFRQSGIGPKNQVWAQLGTVTTSDFAFGGPFSGTLSFTTKPTNEGLLMIILADEPSRTFDRLSQAKTEFEQLKDSIMSSMRLTKR